MPDVPNHALPDPDVNVIYIAADDALYKFFPDSGEVLLWKTLAMGETGYMLGFGGPNTVLAATLIMLPFNASGAADKIWFCDVATGAWTGKTPPEASKKWYSCRANPFDPNKLLLFRRPPDSSNTSTNNALWLSLDRGDTWTNIWTDITNGSNFDWRNSFAEWSPTDGNEWISNRVNGSRYLIRGAGTSYTEHVIGTDGEASAIPGLQGEAFYEGFTNNGYADAANAPHTTDAISYAFGWGNTLHGTRQAAHANLGVTGGSYAVRITTDYTSVAWSAITGTIASHSLAVLTGGIIISGNSANIDTITDAWGSPSITQTSFGIADAITAASSDSQTQTVAAVIRNGTPDGGSAVNQPAVRNPDTGAWALIARPPAATDLANSLEVVIT